MGIEEKRKKIDAIDDQIHDLLMERAEIVIKIGEEKRRSGQPAVQPDREIMVISRLLSRHKGPLPAAGIERIWREIMKSMSLLQMD